MKTRQLGPFEVSAIGLGCMNLSHAYGPPVSREQAERVLLSALDADVTFFDTAALYGFGANETLLGEVLKSHRQRFVLASKCGMQGVAQADGTKVRVIDGRPATLRQTCEDALRRFAEELALAPRLVLGGETALGDALLYAATLLSGAPAQARRQVSDVSGDGAANRGTAPAAARARIVARDITINGLAIVSQEPDLEDYYAREVIGGAGSFVLSALDYEDFRGVIRRKLLRELGPVAAARP